MSEKPKPLKLIKVAECINDGTRHGHWLFAPGYGPPESKSNACREYFWKGFAMCFLLALASFLFAYLTVSF